MKTEAPCVFDTWQDIANRLRTSPPDRGLMLKAAIVIEALAEEATSASPPEFNHNAGAGLHGPFGHLVIARGLDEEHWRLSDGPENDADHVSLPMFTKVDPFSPAALSSPATSAGTGEPAPSAAGASEVAWTEENLREHAKAKGWYVRESASVPNLMTGGWRHPYSITVSSSEMIELLNAAMLTASPAPAEKGEAQPVAWIANDPDGGPYLTWSESAAKTWPNAQPLYASPVEPKATAPAGVVEAARRAVERLANVPMQISLAEWSEISGTILAALSPATQDGDAS